MTKVSTCKFCKQPVTVTIDDDYALLADPFDLMGLLCCNKCGDYETERRKIVRRIKYFCEMLVQRAVAHDDMNKARESLEILVKKYMRLYAEHHDLALADYEAAIVDALMDKPSHFGQVLLRIPRLFQQRSLI